MGFSRQVYWSGLSFPSPGDFYDPGTEPRSCALQADSLPSEPPGKPPNSIISFKLPGSNTDFIKIIEKFKGNES